jgi:hypothetical protein
MLLFTQCNRATFIVVVLVIDINFVLSIPQFRAAP